MLLFFTSIASREYTFSEAHSVWRLLKNTYSFNVVSGMFGGTERTFSFTINGYKAIHVTLQNSAMARFWTPCQATTTKITNDCGYRKVIYLKCDMNMKAIFAVMNTTRAVVKIKPEKIQPCKGFDFFKPLSRKRTFPLMWFSRIK